MGEALEAARAAVDALLWDRAVGRAQSEVAAESALRGAWANAWFDGAEAGLPELRSGAALDASPVGRLLAGVVAMHADLPGLIRIVGTAPAQALARMHAIVAGVWSRSPTWAGRGQAGWSMTRCASAGCSAPTRWQAASAT